jgi:hypothetical protein
MLRMDAARHGEAMLRMDASRGPQQSNTPAVAKLLEVCVGRRMVGGERVELPTSSV